MPELIKPIKTISTLRRRISGIGKGAWRKRPSLPEGIVLRPEIPGRTEDPLEKAAMQGVVGTLPERIIWKWLESQQVMYKVQYGEFGGRGVLGGMTLDFLVSGLAGLTIALRVQGEYWHGPMHDRQSLDDEQAARLRMAGYLVVDLWEQAIYQAVLNKTLRRYLMRRIGR